jgi:uncharacterized phage protein gp47/JayE
MQLSLRTFDAIVSSAAAAVQSAAQTVMDLTVGSVTRAVLEANAGLGLWMQWLILQVLQTTRASTSSAGDLDTWMADFGLTRLPASAATGSATFSRFSPTSVALVPAGTLVRTSDGSQSFSVVADPSNPAWNPAQNGFSLAAGTASITVAISAAVAGIAGNVQAGTIGLIAAALPGVDTVTNASATAGGLNAESDAALRTRFSSFLASLFKATTPAIGYTISSVQQGLQYTVQENATQSGAYQPGCFVVTVDDGTGAPPGSLLTLVANAVEPVRPIGSVWTVVAPTVATANVSMSITTAPAATHSVVASQVSAALESFINTLPVGAPLAWSRLAQVAYAASPSVTNVTGLSLNGSNSDLVPSQSAVVKAGSVTVN